MIPQTSSWMGSRGEGYVVAQLAIVALVVFGSTGGRGLPAWPVGAARVASVGGIALIAFGVALALAGIIALGRNLAAVPRPKPGATLVERGPYRLVRCTQAPPWRRSAGRWLSTDG